MRFSLENIGKIKKANVDLNGITVICGDNNTGKSTIGKALFCVFNACYDIDNNIIIQITSNLLREINREIRTYVMSKINDNDILTVSFVSNASLKGSVNNFLKYFENLSDDIDVGKEQVDSFLSDNLDSKYYSFISGSETLKINVYNLIKSTFKEPIEPHKLTRIKRFFEIVFDEQPINVKCDNAFVSAIIKGNSFELATNKYEGTKLSLNIDFTNHAIFIDSPDEYKITASDWIQNSPKIHTLSQLVQSELDDELDDETEISDVNKTFIEKRLSTVTNILNKAIKGRFKRKSGENRKEFEFEGMDIPINISNLSTGVKSLLLFRTLCECGKLSPKDVLILDEPEIHLHPDWQLVYAEALVALQKELDLTILITSHSPAFVRAIECYCDYYDRMEELDVYCTKEIGDSEYTLENLSYMNYGVSELYDKFSKPFTDLDKMLAEKYN